MPQIKPLPDGRLVEIPDNLTEGQLQWLDQNLFNTPTQQVPEAPEGWSPIESLQEVVKGVPRGFASGFLSSAEGIVSLFDRGNDSPIIDSIQNMKRSLREDSFLAPDEGMEDAWSTKIGEGLGSFATFATPTALVKGLGLAGKAANLSALGAGLGLAGTSGVSQQADFIRASRAKGIDVSTKSEVLGELAGLGIGFSEMLPIFNMFKRIPGKNPKIAKEVKELEKAAEHSLIKNLKRYGRTGVEEAIQETAAGIGQEAVAKGLYDPNIPIGGSAYDDAVVGGTVGFLGNILFDAVIPGRQRNGMDYADNEQKLKDQESRQNFIDTSPEKLSFQIVPKAGQTEKELTFDIVDKNSGVVVGNQKKREAAEAELSRLQNNQNEAILAKEMKSNAKEQGRDGDATSQTAILQANSDYSRNINRGVVLSTIFANSKSNKSNKDNWDKHINKKFKGKTKKDQQKRAYYKGAKQYSPELLLNDKVITKKQYNEIVNEKAEVIAKTSGNKTSASATAINKELKSKNIDEKVGPSASGSKNLQSYFFNLTGKRFWKQMSPEQKKYVLARIQQLPKSPVKRKMVDVTARQYKENQFNNVIKIQDELYKRNNNNKGFTKKEISAMATGKTKPLTKEAENQLIDRLIDSGRVTKEKGKYVFFKNRGKKNSIENENQFQKSMALQSQSYYETANEFKTRLGKLTDNDGNKLLNNKEINQIVSNDNALKRKMLGLGDAEILAPQATYELTNPETQAIGVDADTGVISKQRRALNVRERLSQYGLSAPEGMSPNKVKDMEKVAQFTKNELEKRGLPELAVLSGTIFLDPNAISVTDLSRANAAYVNGVQNLILNYDNLLKKFDPKDRNNLRNISDRVIANRIGQTVNHEIFHAFKDMGLYTPDEWETLKRFVKNTVSADPFYKKNGLKIRSEGKVIKTIENPTYLQIAKAAYRDASPELQYEEAMAEAFGFFTKNPNKFSGKPKNLLTQALDFVLGIFTGWNASGLNAGAIFELSMSGNLVTDERLNQQLEEFSKQEVRNVLKDDDESRVREQRVPLNESEQKVLDALLPIMEDASSNMGDSRQKFIQILEDAMNDPAVEVSRLYVESQRLRDIANAFAGTLRVKPRSNYIRKRINEESIDRQRANFDKRQADKRNTRKPRVIGRPQYQVREGVDRDAESTPEGRSSLSPEEIANRERALRNYQQMKEQRAIPDTGSFDLLDNGMPYSEAPYEFEISFAGLTSEEIDNLTLDDFNQIAKRVRDITGETNFKFSETYETKDKNKNIIKEKSFRTYGELKQAIQESINSGVNMNWYLDIGREAEKIVGQENMLEFSVLWAITSSSTTPETNFRNAIQIMALARGIDPETGKKINKNIKEDSKSFRKNVLNRRGKKSIAKSGVNFSDFIPTASENTVDEIIKFYEDGSWKPKGETAIKTPMYGLTTMMLKDGEYMPFMVADRWMYRILGIDGAISKRKPSRSEMTYAQWMIAELSNNEMFNFNDKPYSLNPSQIQALLWFNIRDNSKQPKLSEGTVDSIMKKSEDLVSAINFAKKDKSWIEDISFINKDNYDLSANELIAFQGRGNYGTSQIPRVLENKKKLASKLLIEVNPGVERGYGKIYNKDGNLDILTIDEVIDLTDRVYNEITDNNGKIILLKELGIAHNVTRSYGAYDGLTNPNFVIDLLGQDISSARVQAIAKILGDALMQDAVVTSQLDYDNGDIGNVMLSKKGDFTVDEIIAIDEAINEEGGAPNYYNPNNIESNMPTGLTAKYNGNQILIVDEQYHRDNGRFKEVSDEIKIERHKQFVEFLQNKISQIDALSDVEYDYVSTKGTYIRGLDKENGYQGGIEEAGISSSTEESSNLQLEALNKLYIPAWKAFKGFLAEKRLTADNNTAPYESTEYTALEKALTPNEVKMQKVVDTLEFMNDNLAGDMIPIFDLGNSSPLAQEAAYDWITSEDKEGIDPLGLDTDPRIREQRGKKGEIDFGDKLWKEKAENLPIGQQVLQGLTGFHKTFRLNYLDRMEAIERSSVGWVDKLNMGMSAAYSAIGAARLGERIKGMMQQALTEGGVIYYTTGTALEGGTKVVQKTFTDRNGNTQQVHLLRAFTEISSKENQKLFQKYGVAKRIQGLTSEERKNSIFLKRLKKEDSKLYKDIMENQGVDAFIENIERTQPNVADAWEQFQQWNDAVIEYARDAGVLNDNVAEIWRENANYFPFYREFDNIDESVVSFFGEDMNGTDYNKDGIIEPLSDSVLTRKLDENIPLKNLEAPFSAITRNSLAIMQVSAKNITRQRLAREQLALFGDDPNSGVRMLSPDEIKRISQSEYDSVFMYKVNGEKKYLAVEDPHIIKAIESFSSDQTLTGVLKWIGVPSNVLREMVTRDPGFMLVNLMRDTLSVYATSGANFTPIIDSIKGWVDPLENINKYGLVSGYDLSNDKYEITKFVDRELTKAQRDKESGGRNLKDFFSPTGLWERLGNWTTRSDASTRQAVYKKVKEATGDEFEAAYQALEVINFNRRGASQVARVVTTGIPFLNARMQGLDVLWRSAATNINVLRGKGQGVRRYGAYQSLYGTENDVMDTRRIGRSFFMRIGVLSAMSALYWLLVSDDEEYKNLKREVRDDNFVIPITKDYAFKYPIAFEVGVLTKVIPERMMDLMFGDATTMETKQSLMRQVSQTFKVDPMAWQIFAPLYEAAVNKNKYTGRPIVGYYQEGLDPSAQYEDYTNELARWVGNTINVSPMKIDHIMKGYLGTIGGYGLMATDKMARVASGRNQSPFGMDQTPVLRRVFLDQKTSRGLQQRYYELKDVVDSVINTERNLRKNKRDFQAAKIFRYNNQDIWSIKNEMNAITRYMTRFRKKRNRILTDETIPYSERKRRILELEADRDRRLMVIPLLQERANHFKWIGD